MRDRLSELAVLLRTIRQFFDGRGFIEVLPRTLTPQCVVDPYIDPIVAEVRGGGTTRRLFLQPSPEAEMKDWLSRGSGSIYSIGPAFRDDETGRHHRNEFTMLEWYEVDVDLDAGMQTLVDLANVVLDETTDRVTYRDAFVQAIGRDPMDTPVQQLAALIADPDLASGLDNDRDAILNVLLDQAVVPSLGRSTILCEYPLSQAALAKPSDRDPACASRFEWFADGVELGNGYDELLDADELVQRTKRANRDRTTAGRATLPMPAALIAAMRRGLPPSVGVAVGLDRLAMVRSGGDRLGP